MIDIYKKIYIIYAISLLQLNNMFTHSKLIVVFNHWYFTM